MREIVLNILALGAFALCMLGVAWIALGEYRKVFMAHPRIVMSLEVFALLAEIGSLGYIAAVLAVVGGWMLLGAMYLGMSLAYSELAQWWAGR